MTKIFYVDPQSYSNLAVYDYSLISNIKDFQIVFYANVKYDYRELQDTVVRKIFCYGQLSHPLSKALSYTKSILRLYKDARKERPDIIHIQWIRLWALDYILVFLLQHLGIKVIHTAHNLLPHVHHTGDRTKYRLYYRAVNGIIVHSERTRNEMGHMAGCEDKTWVIHHGMLPSHSNPDDCARRMEQLKRQKGIDSNTMVFACMGIQSTYKGTDTVLKVWSTSSILQKSNSMLLIVGKNENIDYSPVRNMPNVHIVNGKVPEPDFNAYMQMASVILLPYTAISQSGVLFSALQAGIPVLVSDVGGLAEPLRIAPVGWNIGEPTAEHLREAMERLAQDKGLADQVRNDTEAFGKVRQAYDWKNIGLRTTDMYRKLSDTKRDS